MRLTQILTPDEFTHRIKKKKGKSRLPPFFISYGDRNQIAPRVTVATAVY